MACSTCGSAGTCGCSTVTIPVGPAGLNGTNGTNGTSVTVTVEPPGTNCAYGGVAVTDGLGNVTYVCTGAPGSAGSSGAKYAGTSIVVAAHLGFTNIVISPAALVACGALIDTCIDANSTSATPPTPHALDFNIDIWVQIAGTQWRNVTGDSTWVTGIFYEYTTGCYVTLAQAGTYRVVIRG